MNTKDTAVLETKVGQWNLNLAFKFGGIDFK